MLGTGCAISYNNNVIASEARQSPLLFYEIATLLSVARNDDFSFSKAKISIIELLNAYNRPQFQRPWTVFNLLKFLKA
jgi:hypothetical protein